MKYGRHNSGTKYNDSVSSDSLLMSKLQSAVKKKRKKTKKVDDDEKARKLAEMMANADWREDQRAKKVTKEG